MVRKTKAFQFIQPEGTDRYNIEDQNHNWDQVEKFFKRIRRWNQFNFLLIAGLIVYLARNEVKVSPKRLVYRLGETLIHLTADIVPK